MKTGGSGRSRGSTRGRDQGFKAEAKQQGHAISRLRVSKAVGLPWRGILQAGSLTFSCALGTKGIRSDKREGDRATPRGSFRLTKVLLRRDRGFGGPLRLQSAAIQPGDGWCDDARAPAYNRPIRLPSAVGHEKLCRDDRVYDVVIVLDHNQRPRVRGRGSAIFFHLARPGYQPTEGCVAISAADMRRLLPRLARHVVMDIR